MEIKVCGMRDAENITALCQLPINYIGFIFYAKSPRFVGEDFSEEHANLVPKHIIRTGVFVNASSDYIIEKINRYKLGAIQLHGNESPIFCNQFKAYNCKIIKAFGVDEHFKFEQLEAYKTSVDFLLFDTKSAAHGGTGQKFDWSILSAYQLNIPIILSGGISAQDIDLLRNIPNIPVQCLDLNSRFEIAPAMKDVTLLQTFLNEYSNQKI